MTADMATFFAYMDDTDVANSGNDWEDDTDVAYSRHRPKRRRDRGGYYDDTCYFDPDEESYGYNDNVLDW